MKTIQMLISEKKKIFFSDFLSAFFKCTLNFEPFQKKNNHHRLCISETTHPKKMWLDKCQKSPV